MPRPWKVVRYIAAAYVYVFAASLMLQAAWDFVRHGGIWMEARTAATTMGGWETVFVLGFGVAGLITGWCAMSHEASE